jgi:predicted neutral ceramidase superfamily lipid hydrolase
MAIKLNDHFGEGRKNIMSSNFFLIQIINFIIVLAWVALGILCLLRLSKRQMTSTAKALWVLIILAIPLLGAIAFLVVKPGDEAPTNLS